MAINISYGNPGLIGAASFGIGRERGKRKYGAQSAQMVQGVLDRRNAERKYNIERQDRLEYNNARLNQGGRRRIAGPQQQPVAQQPQLSRGAQTRLALRERANGRPWTPEERAYEMQRATLPQGQRQRMQARQNAADQQPVVSPAEQFINDFEQQHGMQIDPIEKDRFLRSVQMGADPTDAMNGFMDAAQRQVKQEEVRSRADIAELQAFNNETINNLPLIPAEAPLELRKRAGEAMETMRELGVNPQHSPDDPDNQKVYDKAMKDYKSAVDKWQEMKAEQDAAEEAAIKQQKDEELAAKNQDKMDKQQEALNKKYESDLTKHQSRIEQRANQLLNTDGSGVTDFKSAYEKAQEELEFLAPKDPNLPTEPAVDPTGYATEGVMSAGATGASAAGSATATAPVMDTATAIQQTGGDPSQLTPEEQDALAEIIKAQRNKFYIDPVSPEDIWNKAK